MVALLLIVLTGFAALTIDAGVAYTQSRNDQDVADAAALAASYWIFSQASPTSTTIAGAYTAASDVNTLDCRNASCPLTLNFYTGSQYTPGNPPTVNTPQCSATSSSSSCLGTTYIGTGSTMIAYVGATINATATNYFASGTQPFAVNNQAVAQVSATGSTQGSSSPNPTVACEVCIFHDVTSNGSQNSLNAAGGSIDIGGYVFFNSSNDTIKTATGSGYGIVIDGLDQYNSGSVYSNGSSNLIEADGILDIDGGSNYAIYFNSSNDEVETNTGTKSNINISGSVHLNGGTISPSQYGTAATPAFSDPLAGIGTPAYTDSKGNTFSAPSYSPVSGDTIWTNHGSWTYPYSPSCPSSETLSPGIYTTIQNTACSNATINFQPGLYVLDGTGSEQGLFINSGTTTLSGSGVTFYFTCNSGGNPAACGTYNYNSSTGKGSCASTSNGAQFYNNAAVTLNLAGGSDSNDILFFADRCNSSDVMYVNSSGLTASSGYPSGTLYAYSGTVFMNASTNAIPSPMLIGWLYYNTSSSTLGTTSGSIAIGGASSPVVGGLVQ